MDSKLLESDLLIYKKELQLKDNTISDLQESIQLLDSNLDEIQN